MTFFHTSPLYLYSRLKTEKKLVGVFSRLKSLMHVKRMVRLIASNYKGNCLLVEERKKISVTQLPTHFLKRDVGL